MRKSLTREQKREFIEEVRRYRARMQEREDFLNGRSESNRPGKCPTCGYQKIKAAATVNGHPIYYCEICPHEEPPQKFLWGEPIEEESSS